MDDNAELHLAVCRRFGEAVAAATGRWDRPSPCDAWDARGVLEHVIGFHDVLLLRPLGLKPDRPREDPLERWRLTYRSLTEAFTSGVATRLDAYPLIPNLTRDVLVHTWDLARAAGADDSLDPEWCERFCVGLPTDSQTLGSGAMFKASLVVPAESDAQTRLLAGLGRDPRWRPRTS